MLDQDRINQGQLTSEIMELNGRLSHISETIGILAEKLAPVLTPDHPAPTSNDKFPDDSPVCSPLASRLQEMCTMARRVNNELTYLMERLDV